MPDGSAVCDNFLTDNQQILTEAQWLTLQAQWGVVECVSANDLANVKIELEQLCSVAKCSYPTQQAIKALKKILSSRGM